MQKTIVAVTTVLLGAPLAWAETPEWQGEVELGLLITTGNTEETNVNSRLAFQQEIVRWRNSGEFSSLYSEADGATSAEKYRAFLESDFKFNDRQYWFLRGAYEDDRFSGYDFESSITTGYGHRVWQGGERSFLDLSAGAGYRYNRFDEPDENGHRKENESIARLAGQFDYELSETALFRQKLSSEIGLEDGHTISESETSLQATVVDSLSMKVSYRVKHLSDPPAASERTDTETALTLLYGF
ncbi:DUF481 domain-containing protein [Marinobacter mobilis]|uniref:Putative salt-induced outer membrane protein YdiY n=1 Tax=Marinobacter mobilis TaxID=488533 RepID=A0A1H2RD86_9GAMM|nr:DUF481 domain-containing protein [Marinobacter mobilis]SDW17377.1 Putative salt-induced outer membrane protein YdiY [Marinobacter mobilis]